MIRLRLDESLDDPQFASEFQVSAYYYRILFIILYAMYFDAWVHFVICVFYMCVHSDSLIFFFSYCTIYKLL